MSLFDWTKEELEQFEFCGLNNRTFVQFKLEEIQDE